jgi:hypothetical protein
LIDKDQHDERRRDLADKDSPSPSDAAILTAVAECGPATRLDIFCYFDTSDPLETHYIEERLDELAELTITHPPVLTHDLHCPDDDEVSQDPKHVYSIPSERVDDEKTTDTLMKLHVSRTDDDSGDSE